MCQTCGCSTEGEAKLTDLGSRGGHALHAHGHDHTHPHHGHDHDHHDHEHVHDHDTRSTPATRTLQLEEALLAKNDRLAERNRGWLEAKSIVALNLMSSPGAGKTTLLERTIRKLSAELPLCVIEGDQETTRDAERIRATGCRVLQINTGSGCHLDADMIAGALQRIEPPAGSLLLIENVGNLVCPALFDLGERGKVVIMSVTEGEDKPLKYPHMFRAGEVLILNKIDLLPYVQFDVDLCLDYARGVNPSVRVFQVSATRGDGLDAWYDWLRTQMSGAAASREASPPG